MQQSKRKRLWERLLLKNGLIRNKLQKKKESKEYKDKRKERAPRPKTEHKEVFLAYSYMKKIRKPKGVKNRSIAANDKENIGIFE